MRIVTRALCVALSLAAVFTATGAAAERLTLELEIRETIGKIFDSKMEACKRESGHLARLTADSRFPQQSPRVQGLVHMTIIACSPSGSAKTLGAARALVALPVEPGMAYFGHDALMDDAWDREAPDDYLTHLYAIIDGDPSLLADWEPKRLRWIFYALRDDPVRDGQLLIRLHEVPWTSQTLQDMDRNEWAVRRARRLLETGDRSKARSTILAMTSADNLLTVAQDRRFEPLWTDLEAEGRFDWVKIAQAQLADQQARMKAAPNTLEPVAEAIDGLRTLGRFDEAVALGEAYAARLRAGETFTDAADHRSWMLNLLAYAYFDLGRYDEADKTVLEAVGKDRVSQTINRAVMLNRAARPNEALKALAAVDIKQTAQYGLMLVDANKACARVQLGDKAAAEALVAGMRSRWKDNAGALGDALACVDAQDELAALYVKRLEDPVERAVALSDFRTTLPPPKQAPFAAAMDARDEAARARPEVLAALAKWGRPVTVPLWGDL